MILVVGGTGNVGGAAVRALAANGVPVRALSRNPARLPDLGPTVEAVEGDMARPETIAAALAGADGVLLATGGDNLPEVEPPVIRLAEEASVGHVVLLSSLGVEYGAGSGPVHVASEEALRASSVPWTILRPLTFMTNTLRWSQSIAATGTFQEPTGTGAQAMIDPGDVGAVAAAVLTTPGHAGKTYELTGPEALTSAQYAAALTTALGREVRHVDVDEESYQAQFARYGAPPALIASIMTLFALVKSGKLDFVRPDVEAILGRPARSFGEWAGENAAAFGV